MATCKQSHFYRPIENTLTSDSVRKIFLRNLTNRMTFECEVYSIRSK